MNRQLLIPAIGAFGLAAALVYSFSYGEEASSIAHYLSMPPSSPYAETVWGTGVIEANSRNVAVGSYRSGIVAKVFVTESDEVEEGAPLFKLDDRSEKSQLKMQSGATEAAKARLLSVDATLGDRQDELRRLKSLKPGIEVSLVKLQQAVFAADKAKSDYDQAKAQLEVARAEETTARVALEQMTVHAPSSGRIMKINLSPGEFVTAGATQTPPILMGNDRPLYVRVNIDESDLWRFDPQSEATASLRGHSDIKAPLSFVRTEPYVMPKDQLNNLPGERVDTRVLQVIYRIDGDNPSLFIGQQMDICVKARSVEAAK